MIYAETEAQTLSLTPKFQGKTIQLDSVYYPLGDDSISFSTFKIYISQLKCYKQGQLIFEEKAGFHLLDLSKANGMTIYIPKMKDLEFDEVQFSLGIDSVTNVSGAMGGDLDPTKGMYWTWHSGYINAKIEGYSNICLTRKHLFEFHLGGYNGADNALQTLRIKLGSSRRVNLSIQLDEVINIKQLASQSNIMTPGPPAVNLMYKLAQAITLDTP